MSARSAVRAGLAGMLWWWRSFMGDNDYSRYLTSMARAHPGEPVLTEREFWRQKHGEQVAPRCC